MGIFFNGRTIDHRLDSGTSLEKFEEIQRESGSAGFAASVTHLDQKYQQLQILHGKVTCSGQPGDYKVTVKRGPRDDKRPPVVIKLNSPEDGRVRISHTKYDFSNTPDFDFFDNSDLPQYQPIAGEFVGDSVKGFQYQIGPDNQLVENY